MWLRRVSMPPMEINPSRGVVPPVTKEEILAPRGSPVHAQHFMKESDVSDSDALGKKKNVQTGGLRPPFFPACHRDRAAELLV